MKAQQMGLLLCKFFVSLVSFPLGQTVDLCFSTSFLVFPPYCPPPIIYIKTLGILLGVGGYPFYPVIHEFFPPEGLTSVPLGSEDTPSDKRLLYRVLSTIGLNQFELLPLVGTVPQ